MSDLLVRLYDLPPVYPLIEELKKKNIIIRRPIGPENYIVIDWIKKNFGDMWAGEAENAFFRSPKGIFLAIREPQNNDGSGDCQSKILGFACYDATVKGFFGPTGVLEEERGQNLGKALLLSCLHAMHDEGYGYGVIGSAGPVHFYEKCCGAIEIPNSDPGIYKGFLY